jgi:uncharacterized caspase-like protein
MSFSRREMMQSGLAALAAPLLLGQARPEAPPPDDRGAGNAGREGPATLGQDIGRAAAEPLPPIHALILSQSYAGKGALALSNTARDAELMSRTFRHLRFEQLSVYGDAAPDRALDGLSGFLGGVDQERIALLYLAGHAIEVGGENLFLLGDGRSFLSLQALVGALQERAGVTILFLDACRNNPLLGGAPSGRVARATATRSAGKARLETVSMESLASGAAGRLRAFSLRGSGVKIVFSTDPGNFALDGAGPNSRNSPFAQALARRLREPRSLDDVVALTTGDVLAATKRRQSPWSQGSVDRPIFLAARRTRTAPVAGAPTGSLIQR